MITTAIERNGTVFVYGEHNNQIFSVMGQLHGFTSTTVSVKRGNTIFVYDTKGNQINSFMSF